MKCDVKTLCPYCGVGCGIIASTDGQRILRVRGDPKHPANFGKLCQKGASVAQTAHSPTRLHYPMIRDECGQLVIRTTDAAIQSVATRLEQIIQTDGPGAVGFYLSGQLTTEAQYVANKFAKGILRTNHVDSNSRLCMASAASGMKLSLGSDGPPTCYEDIDLADTFIFIGSNAAECHPVIFDRVQERVKRKKAKCIVVDPRRTLTAQAADLHIAPKPGTDLALLNGLLRFIRNAGALDNAYIVESTEGWHELNQLIEGYSIERVCDICNINEDAFRAMGNMIINGGKLLTFWTMGVNQTLHGTFTSSAIINLHLATGQIGKPGCGPFSLTGQPNAMGGRDVGYMSHTLPGQREIYNPEHRAQMETFWHLPAGHIHSEPGYDAVRMFDALDRGELKALWIIGSNPAASMPNLPKIRSALSKAQLIIVQDAYYPTETTQYAHIVLPAAITFEQSGTFCNSERRISLMQQVIPPPAEAKPDWWWIREVAHAMNFVQGMSFNTSAQIFDEFVRSTSGRPNDQTGMHHELLQSSGPQQWPFTPLRVANPRRFQSGVFSTESGKAKFQAHHYELTQERTSADHPLLLTTGRVIGHWHTRTKTGLVPQLNANHPSPTLSMHPQDATDLHLLDGQPLSIQSKRGTAESVLKIDALITPGVVFMPIHWNALFAESASTNEVTDDATDPISRQPSLKVCAVSVKGLA